MFDSHLLKITPATNIAFATLAAGQTISQASELGQAAARVDRHPSSFSFSDKSRFFIWAPAGWTSNEYRHVANARSLTGIFKPSTR